ncbi:uncharacterized protein LOC141537259 isoform X1 [Cotesia typhae]|uniref:uncharacterized protein LOC141537259 isoform X1 n=1 Tax=Cotesia typhae TaxID=2053667 RepID=UPI003D690CBC
MQSNDSYVIDPLPFSCIEEVNTNYEGIYNHVINDVNYEELCLGDAVGETQYTNDNFLDFVDEYCQEKFSPLLYSTNDLKTGEFDKFSQNEKQEIIHDQCNLNFISEHPYIFVLNQSENILPNKNSKVQIMHDYVSLGQNKPFITIHQDAPCVMDETDFSPKFNLAKREYRHHNIVDERSINCKDFSKLSSSYLQQSYTTKKDENFHKKLISMINDNEIEKLSGEIYSLEYYRSCNKLLSMKSRPLANLRQTNEDAERNHKALVDLNKKCRSIIRKFKNGLFTIDTIFKWNELRSKDGPMSCSICRCNKFFKRPGSIANHIYRVHERILREALERGELHKILETNQKQRDDWSIENNQHLTIPCEELNQQNYCTAMNSMGFKLLHESSPFLSSCNSSLDNYDSSYSMTEQKQNLDSNIEKYELEQALITLKKDFDKF